MPYSFEFSTADGRPKPEAFVDTNKRGERLELSYSHVESTGTLRRYRKNGNI